METQRDIVSRHPNNGTMNIDIVSFTRLAYRVFGELGINELSVLDDTGKMLILRKVIEDNRDKLTIFKNKVKMFGFAEEIKSTISELYQYGIDVEDIDEMQKKISGHNMMKSKLADIRVIYDSFTQYVKNISSKEVKYITKEEVLDELCEVINDSNILKDSTVVLDGFTGFTPIQYKLIGHILQMAKKVIITVTMSGEEAEKITAAGFMNIKEQELFNMSKTTVNQLMRLAAENDIKVDKPVIFKDKVVYRLKDNESLSFIENNIFRTGKSKIHACHDNIQIFCAENPIEESYHIANMIANMVRESNGSLRYRDIAIITGDMELYRRPLEDSLTLNNIPYFIDNKKSLLNNNFVECIRALLEMLDENFTYETVFRYLKRGMSSLSSEEIDIFENYVLGCGICGLKQYNNPFRKRYKNLSEEEFIRCEEIRCKFIEPIIVLEEAVNGENVENITKAVYRFIKDNKLYDKLNKYIEEFDDEDTNKQEYAQVYRLVMELFDKLVSLIGKETITLKEYRKILDDGLEEIKVGTIPVLIDQMVVGDIERTRLNNIKVLVVAGVNDGTIPKYSGKSGLLSQSDRNVLKNISVEMSPTSRENGFIQKFYLYLNLTKPKEKLIMTYSAAGLTGSAKRPSYLIDSVTKLFDDLKPVGFEEKGSINISSVVTKEAAFKLISKGLRDYDSENMGELWKELFSYYTKKEEFSERRRRALEGAFFNNRAGKLDKAVAKVVYGDNIEGSVTRLEKYAECAYAYFLMYGLNLVERQIMEIKPADVGNLYHKAVEVFSNKIKEQGMDFKNIDDETRKKLVDLSVNEAIIYYGYEQITESARNQYILEKVRKVTDKSAWAICEHIKRGKFNPEIFELSLNKGRIDRVDRLELGDNVYIKIIDYKSGSTKFDSEKLVNGLQLQLIYYMDAVLDLEKRNNKGKNIQPGGVFYFNIKDPVIDYEESLLDDDVYERKLLGEYQMSGVFNSGSDVVWSLDSRIGDDKRSSSAVFKGRFADIDKEDVVKTDAMGLSTDNFLGLMKYVDSKICDMVEDIKEGKIAANPYKKSQYTSCDYCKYGSVCNFSRQDFNDAYRKLKKIDKGGGEA